MLTTKTTTVDDFVKDNVLPEHQEIVAMIRNMMRELAPNAREILSYGMPCWKGNWIFAFIISTKKDITFAFARGVEFEDNYALLKGKAKSTRHVKMKTLGDINTDALRYYIEQALEYDTKWKFSGICSNAHFR